MFGVGFCVCSAPLIPCILLFFLVLLSDCVHLFSVLICCCVCCCTSHRIYTSYLTFNYFFWWITHTDLCVCLVLGFVNVVCWFTARFTSVCTRILRCFFPCCSFDPAGVSCLFLHVIYVHFQVRIKLIFARD